MGTTLIQMKIELAEISPTIWRKFIVESSITLDDLHDVVQTVMGWDNSHLYSFEIMGQSYLSPNAVDEDSDFGNAEQRDTTKVKLSQLSLRKKSKLLYLYDFGDNWEHVITVEDIVPATENSKVPICLEGQRACPPEDCGSIPGYEDIVDAIKNPKKKESKELLEWLGEYDPEEFDVKEINSVLKPKKIK
jgi:hypothetical protein